MRAAVALAPVGGIIPRDAAEADFLTLSRERDRWQALLDARTREAYQRGRADGLAAGRAEGWVAAIAHVKAAQHHIARSLARLPRKIDTSPRPGDWPGLAAGPEAVAAWRATRRRAAR
jgi:hypothetical protein